MSIRLLAGLAAFAVLFVAGCGAGQTSNASFNNADVTFAQSMIPHHQQAIVMARMASTNTQNPTVKQLASQIEAAQTAEIQTMTGWLQTWGKPVPSGSSGMMPGMPSMMSPPSGVSQSPGMMSAHDMDQLQGMRGTQFDRMFLEMMIKHHQGAVAMAKTEQGQGANPDAKRMAAQIEANQTSQISQMQGMLNSMS